MMCIDGEWVRWARICGLIPDEAVGEFECHDCLVNVSEIREYSYMVLDEVWRASGLASNGGMLCVACLERRLLRRLCPADFDSRVPLNNVWCQSDVLHSRIGGRYGPGCHPSRPHAGESDGRNTREPTGARVATRNSLR